MRLILVRHAEAQLEGGLSERGRRHAEVIAREIAEVASRTLPVAAAYAGPDDASIETAEIIAGSLGIASPTPDTAFADLIADSDTLGSAQLSAWSAVESIQEQSSPDSTLVLVCAEMPLRLLVCSALSIPLGEKRRFRIDPGSLTTLDFRLQPQRRTILAGLNEVCHLGEVHSSR